MTPGRLARTVLGPKLFPMVGRLYRSIFVSLDKVAASLPDLPPGTTLLEIGGGDGALMNAVLRRFPEVHATLIDLASVVGGFLESTIRQRVKLLPATSMAAFQATMTHPPDVVLIADVLHHVLPLERPKFFADLRSLVADHPTVVIVKDVEPGHPLSWLSILADKYISGDRDVALISKSEVLRLMRDAFGSQIAAADTPLYEINPPNYALVFSPLPKSTRREDLP